MEQAHATVLSLWSQAKAVDLGLESYWWGLQKWTGLNDHHFFWVTFLLGHTGVFLVLNAMLYLVHKYRLFEQYKIQKEKYPEGELLKECLKHLARNHFLTMPIQVYFAYYLIQYVIGDTFQGPLPSVPEVALQVFGCMVVEDTLFYWAHRALHHRSIYKYVHKKHHEFKVSVGIASEYAHPIEEILANTVPFATGPLIWKVHHVSLVTWLVIRIVETIDAHSGYTFPLSPFQLLPWLQGGSDRHDFHHSHNLGSYGSFFTFWDWITGTDQPYKKWRAEQDEIVKKLE
eukprot:comp23483_c0_seq1/m.39272 comp23483_c0_seq1/g.39272  ORF comp23483_c0_seq1/g.39272 comp23483_c0_seq1/m.39272 type:complete len:287 (-) comp23483_c0_seq1:388-1248(-)